MMRISVHVLTKNRPVEFYGMVVSLLNQSFQDWDLIVIDESAKPMMQDFPSVKTLLTGVKLDGHNVIYEHNKVSRGIAAARNIAIKKDDMNDWCCRVDDDSILSKSYLEELTDVFDRAKDKNIGAIGGLVPTFGVPMLKRNIKVLNDGKFNKILFKDNFVSVADDGGYLWTENQLLDSDHLRSSFLFNKKAAYKVGLHSEDQGGVIGWREETTFCMKLKLAGYDLLTDTDAIAWHNRTPVGGARIANYADVQALNEKHFQVYWLRKMRLGHIPKGVFG